MRAFSAELKQHLEQPSTTVCTCWILVRKDGTKLGFTDHDQTLEIEGVSCAATTGFQPTQAVSELGLSPDNQEVEGVLNSEAISESDLIAGKYDGASVEIWLVNWRASQQRHHMRRAILGEVNREDGIFRAELRSMTSLLDQVQGRTFSRNCDVQLGSERCGVDLDLLEFSATGQVSEILDRRRLRCVGLEAYEAGWFGYGKLQWTSGDNESAVVEIVGGSASRIDELEIWTAMPFPIHVGDTFNLTAGCNKTFETCKSKFTNGLNYQGCPHMPGTDFVLGYADSGTIHDGSALIK